MSYKFSDKFNKNDLGQEANLLQILDNVHSRCLLKGFGVSWYEKTNRLLKLTKQRLDLYELRDFKVNTNESFSTYAKFSEKLAFLTPDILSPYQGVSDASFLENLAYVLNE